MPPFGAGDRAAHDYILRCGVNLDNVEVLNGDLLDAHVVGADLAWKILTGRCWSPWNQRDGGQGRRRGWSGSCRRSSASRRRGVTLALAGCR